MLWKAFRRITATGTILGAVCGALFILIMASGGMARHPDAGAIPAALVLSYIAGLWGGLFGLAWGGVNGLLVTTVALALLRMMRSPRDMESMALFGTIVVVAGVVNVLVARAVLHFWTSGGTVPFIQLPILVAGVAAVVTDLWVTRWIDRQRRAQPG